MSIESGHNQDDVPHEVQRKPSDFVGTCSGRVLVKTRLRTRKCAKISESMKLGTPMTNQILKMEPDDGSRKIAEGSGPSLKDL